MFSLLDVFMCIGDLADVVVDTRKYELQSGFRIALVAGTYRAEVDSVVSFPVGVSVTPQE